jgi:hypothetical protein
VVGDSTEVCCRRNLAIDARIGYRLDLRRKQSLVFRRDAHVFRRYDGGDLGFAGIKILSREGNAITA